MQVINGNRVSKVKSKALIYKALGKKTSFLEAYAKKGIGVAGLEYIAGIDEIDRTRKDLRLLANIETRPRGILIYLNNPEERYYIILPFEDIRSIVYKKEADEIAPKNNGLFAKVLRWTKKYYMARKYLLDSEIIELQDAIMSIHSHTSFTLKNKKDNYLKAGNYLKSLKNLETIVDLKD